MSEAALDSIKTIEEISLNLGLAIDTVESHIERFHEQGVVSLSENLIRLSNGSQLEDMAERFGGKR